MNHQEIRQEKVIASLSSVGILSATMHFIRLPMILLSSCYTVPSTLVKGIWDWVVNYLWYYLYASHSFHSFHSIEWWCPSHLPRVCSVKAWSENVLSLLYVCASHLSYFLGISEILFVLLRRAVNPPKHETARSICFSCQNVFFFCTRQQSEWY